MADFTALKTAIQTYIKQNGNEEITGEILQEILLSVVTTLGDSAINDLVTALNDEVAARQNADGTLQQNITNEATARGNADTALGGRIDDEATARANGDTALSNRLGSSITAENTAADQIGAEAEARAAADTALQGLIDGITDNIKNGYVYAGIATPSSTPATGKVFYLALTAGTYTNFGNTEVSQGINILKYNGTAWSLDAFIGIDDELTPGSNNIPKSGNVLENIIKNGSAFDLSAYNAEGGVLATYADLDAALTALNALPAVYKQGGMSFRFVRTSDNKYVQYMCKTSTWSSTPTDWEKVNNVSVSQNTSTGHTDIKVGDKISSVASASELGTDSGVLCSGTYEKGTILFTNADVNVGDRILIKRTEGFNSVAFLDANNQELYHSTHDYEETTIPEGFAKAKVDYGAAGTSSTFTIINASQIKYRVKQLEDNTSDLGQLRLAIGNNTSDINELESKKVSKSEIGTDSGILCEGTYPKGTLLFTIDNVSVGDTIAIKRIDGTNYVTFYNSSNQELYHNTRDYEETTIPAGFAYAKIDYSTGSSTYKVTDVSYIRYRIKQLEDKSAEIDEIEEKLDSKVQQAEIGTDNGVLCNGTFNKYATLFTATDVTVGDRIVIERTEGDNAVTFYDAENQELYHSTHDYEETTIPEGFAVAKVDYGGQPSSTFFITDTSQIRYRITALENKIEGNSGIIGENDYGVISAKIELPSDAHDENGICEIMSVKSNANSNVALKFILKKALTSVFDTAVGICPVPKYNAGILAGYAINKVIWHSGKSLSWQSGFIVNDDTGKCSNKLLVTFNSITVNTSGTDVRICWYFDETTSNIEWTRYTTALVDETINVPSGAKYFAISTQITDTNASVVFDTYALEGGFISPDGWNKNLLLGTDTIALRFTGDVTDSANQDIRLKIDDSAVTIYHGTNNSVIHTFSKTSYPDAESLYAALSELTDFSVEMLDVCGVVFDDFIKGDVALVAQYSIKKQSDPSTFVTEWDAFPFYFTTKEKKGIYNFEFGIDSSDTNGKKVQAVLNGYPLFSTSELHNFVGNPLEITYGEDIVVHNHNFNLQGDFYCPIRRMFYVEGMVEGNVNGTGGAAPTCSAKIEEAFDIMIRNGGKNIGYEDLMKEVTGDYKTSRAQFTFTSDDNGFPLYENDAIRNMFVRKGVTPSTFFMLNSNISSRLSIIKACLMAGYYCGIHSPYEYSADINIGSMKYSELVDAVSKSFAKFVELFDRQPLVWDFHRDAESYNTVRYLMNHGFKFIMGGGYGGDYGIVSTITRYRIQRFGIRPNSEGNNVRMPNDWLFRKY